MMVMTLIVGKELESGVFDCAWNRVSISCFVVCVLIVPDVRCRSWIVLFLLLLIILTIKPTYYVGSFVQLQTKLASLHKSLHVRI